MTTSSAPIAVAAYMEFLSEKAALRSVNQILVIPELHIPGETSITPTTVFRRRVTTVRPKTQWKHFSTARNSVAIGSSLGVHSPYTTPTVEGIADEMLGSLVGTFSQLNRAGYKPVNGSKWPDDGVVRPIFAEVAPEDVSDIRLGRTPYKILNRVMRVRKERGFPESLV